MKTLNAYISEVSSKLETEIEQPLGKLFWNLQADFWTRNHFIGTGLRIKIWVPSISAKRDRVDDINSL